MTDQAAGAPKVGRQVRDLLDDAAISLHYLNGAIYDTSTRIRERVGETMYEMATIEALFDDLHSQFTSINDQIITALNKMDAAGIHRKTSGILFGSTFTIMQRQKELAAKESDNGMDGERVLEPTDTGGAG